MGTSTLYRWLERGERDFEDGRASLHRELWEAVKKAEADAEVHALQLIRESAARSWQAAAWLLERKHPDRWGRRTRLEHQHDPRPRHEAPAIPDDEEWHREVARILREAEAAQEPKSDTSAG